MRCGGCKREGYIEDELWHEVKGWAPPKRSEGGQNQLAIRIELGPMRCGDCMRRMKMARQG